ncbi:MAG: sigma-70 family RNA polymerase sigma factor [Deltaproteobacteria bacterium]|nr:sigma-70 family RNA polymerase sigma factor [Deltaproteobacteria bacterium]
MRSVVEEPTSLDLTSHTAWLRRRALCLVRSEELAHDLVQDTLLAYLRRPPAIEHSLKAWLEGALRNQFRMWCRSHKRREQRELVSAAPDAIASPESEVDQRRWSERLAQTLEQLPEPYQTTLRQRYYDHLRPAEIAKTLGIPQSTVRRRNLVALSMLRERMQVEFMPPTAEAFSV